MSPDARPRVIEVFEGFESWLRGLKDPVARSKIRVRLNRAAVGNMGDHAPVGEGVQELRLDYGPGYRIYYGEHGSTVVVLLGGIKQTQARDIERAKVYWRGYKRG